MQSSFQVDFAVVGVVKGGTTSLYHYLSPRPQIYLPPIKETNHFAAADMRPDDFLPSYALDVKVDLDAYTRGEMKKQIHIAHVNSKEHYEALFRNARDEKILGEISNSYMICPSAARAIYDHNPKTKILVVLRNPIKRAWSQYLMNLREAKTECDDFIEELLDDEKANPKGWGVNHQYLELGKYYGQLKKYHDLFGKNQVMSVFYEEYRRNPKEVLSRIASFLNVNNEFSFDFSKKSNTASMPRNRTLNSFLVKSGIVKTAKDLTPKFLREQLAKLLYSEKELPTLQGDHIAWLKKYYAEEVDALQTLLGRDTDQYWPEFKRH